MEFYKIVEHGAGCRLETECGQTGLTLDHETLCQLAQLLYACYQRQEQLHLRFRRYFDRLLQQRPDGIYCVGRSAMLIYKTAVRWFCNHMARW